MAETQPAQPLHTSDIGTVIAEFRRCVDMVETLLNSTETVARVAFERGRRAAELELRGGG